jgi:hypothetical protein
MFQGTQMTLRLWYTEIVICELFMWCLKTSGRNSAQSQWSHLGDAMVICHRFAWDIVIYLSILYIYIYTYVYLIVTGLRNLGTPMACVSTLLVPWNQIVNFMKSHQILSNPMNTPRLIPFMLEHQLPWLLSDRVWGYFPRVCDLPFLLLIFFATISTGPRQVVHRSIFFAVWMLGISNLLGIFKLWLYQNNIIIIHILTSLLWH